MAPRPVPSAARDRGARRPLARAMWFGLGLVLLLGLALRLVGIGHLLPSHLDPDWDLIYQIETFREGDDSPVHRRAYSLFPHLLARTISLLPDPKLEPGDPTPRNLEEHLGAASAFLVQVRTVMALISFLIVPGTWLLARRFLSPGAALFATLLMATSLLQGHFSQQARPHSPAGALVVLSIVASLRFVRRRDLGSCILASFAAALALGSLHNAAAAYLPLAVAFCFCLKSVGKKTWLWALIPVAFTLASLAAFYPFVFVETGFEDRPELSANAKTFDLWGHHIFYDFWTGEGFGRMANALWSYEPWLALLAPLGLIVWLARRRGRSWWPSPELTVALAYVVPYILVVGMYTGYERFVIPLLPFLCCASAYGLAGLREVLAARLQPHARRLAYSLVALMVVGLPLYAALRFAWMRCAPSSTTEVARWIEGHTDAKQDRIVLIPRVHLPLLWSDHALEQAGREYVGNQPFAWVTHQRRFPAEARQGTRHRLYWAPLTRHYMRGRPEDLEALYGTISQADYVVLEVFRLGRNVPVTTHIRTLLTERSTRVARIGPDGNVEAYDDPFLYQEETRVDPFHFVWRVLRGRSLGPVYEIYRI